MVLVVKFGEYMGCEFIRWVLICVDNFCMWMNGCGYLVVFCLFCLSGNFYV